MSPGCTGSAPHRVPLIARVAGLGADTITALGNPDIPSLLADLEGVTERLAALRAVLVDRLYEAVPDAVGADRKLLLQVKRDLYNGRPVTRHADSPRWARVEAVCDEATGNLAEVLRLEAREEELTGALDDLLTAEVARETAHLASLLDGGDGGDGLLRGIALGSPALLEAAARRTQAGDERNGRKERAARTSLLRYVSRAALKLSPCSTLTRVGLAETRDDASSPRFTPGPWREDSLLRLRRAVLGRVWAAVLRHRPLADSLSVSLNPTLEETETDRYRFLRPGHWALEERDAGDRRLIYRRESVVEVRLGGALVDWLRRELPRRPATGGELVTRLAGELGNGAADEDKVRGFLRPLTDAGFLVVSPPWAAQEARFEDRLLELLEGFDGLESVRSALARLVALEADFARADDPVRTVRAVEDAAHAAWCTAARTADLDPAGGLEEFRRGHLYEDVFVSAENDAATDPATEEESWGAVLAVSHERMEALARTLSPLYHLADFCDARHEWALSLTAFALRTWPGRREVPVLELFSAASDLWRAYVRHQLEGADGTFNPLGLSEIDDLETRRRELRRDLNGLTRPGADGEVVLDADGLAALAERIPARRRSPLGGSFLLQPADSEGRRWVLNKLFTGSGRLGSRFTPTMPEAIRARYLRHLKARARRPDPASPGEAVELLDVLCVQGDTLNVHEIQTPRVLELPGQPSGLPGLRRRGLAELSVRFEVGRPPVLVDDAGRRFLAVHLGLASHQFMPVVVRFLTALGPGEPAPVWPQIESDGAVPRLVLGDVVLHRKAWRVEAPPAEALRTDGADGFATLHRWRVAAGLPDRVYWAEPRDHQLSSRFHKPQYLDWTSPACVELFRSAHRPGDEPVFVEALPAVGDFPTDGRGRPRAVEIVLDELALAPVHEPTHEPIHDPAHDAPFAGRVSESRVPRDAGTVPRPRAARVSQTVTSVSAPPTP